MKLSNWQEWNSWTKCKNGERLRFRTCLSFKIIDNTIISRNINFTDTDNTTIDNSSSLLCELKQTETERQFCFELNNDKNTGQTTIIDSNPFMIEDEIAAINFRRRPKINPKSIKAIEIHRD